VAKSLCARATRAVPSCLRPLCRRSRWTPRRGGRQRSANRRSRFLCRWQTHGHSHGAARLPGAQAAARRVPRADQKQILKPIMVTLARRLADALAGEDQAGSPHPRTIAVINAGPWPVPEVFRRELTRALVRYGEVASIDANSVAAAFPEDPMLESDGVTLPLRSLFRRCRDRRPRAAPRIAPT
jgi:hypothetical protein